MIPWTKMPAIIRELRIAWVIPELRPFIRVNVMLRLTRWALLPFQIVLSLPVGAFALVAAALIFLTERGTAAIWKPSHALRESQQENVRRTREIMPTEEIRRRAFGEEVSILPKSTPLDDIVAEANSDTERTP